MLTGCSAPELERAPAALRPGLARHPAAAVAAAAARAGAGRQGDQGRLAPMRASIIVIAPTFRLLVHGASRRAPPSDWARFHHVTRSWLSALQTLDFWISHGWSWWPFPYPRHPVPSPADGETRAAAALLPQERSPVAARARASRRSGTRRDPMGRKDVSEDDLHAFVDGQLGAGGGRCRVIAHLAADPAAASPCGPEEVVRGVPRCFSTPR